MDGLASQVRSRWIGHLPTLFLWWSAYVLALLKGPSRQPRFRAAGDPGVLQVPGRTASLAWTWWEENIWDSWPVETSAELLEGPGLASPSVVPFFPSPLP